jgi:hypothetical protein
MKDVGPSPGGAAEIIPRCSVRRKKSRGATKTLKISVEKLGGDNAHPGNASKQVRVAMGHRLTPLRGSEDFIGFLVPRLTPWAIL